MAGTFVRKNKAEILSHVLPTADAPCSSRDNYSRYVSLGAATRGALRQDAPIALPDNLSDPPSSNKSPSTVLTGAVTEAPNDEVEHGPKAARA